MRAVDDGIVDALQIRGARGAAAFAQALGDFGNDGMQTHFMLRPSGLGVDAFSSGRLAFSTMRHPSSASFPRKRE
ncbi:hypothetical protein GCM10007901_03860 [Dyella acidisoli]|uniref:Uncharacterized protein n=1 Tax=Dyella acidisoli TaxID=1867834 RepID=A0ABQ5XIB1_9GAMM|nr:hypothetical protein GCM10007901_03860 [Dyella acidisoli]